VTDLLVVVPTRARPHSVAPLLRAMVETCRAYTTVVLALDGDEAPHRYDEEVLTFLTDAPAQARVSVYLTHQPRRRMIGTLNHVAAEAITNFEPRVVAYLGDDHRPETVGWDAIFCDVLAETGPGLVYGDDGHQHENLPTAVAASVEIVTTLGYLVPPQLVHMYCDNYWLDLGRSAEAITYLPEVHITHQHPAVHPGGMWDASYAESNAAQRYAEDKAAYDTFVTSGALAADVARVRALRQLP